MSKTSSASSNSNSAAAANSSSNKSGKPQGSNKSVDTIGNNAKGQSTASSAAVVNGSNAPSNLNNQPSNTANGGNGNTTQGSTTPVAAAGAPSTATFNWAKVAAAGNNRSNLNSAQPSPAQTPGATTPNVGASRNSSASGQPRQQQQQQQQQQGNAGQQQPHSRKPSAAAEPFSMAAAAGSKALPIKAAAGEAPGIAFGSLADTNATLSSSPAQRPPMSETRPSQFGSVPTNASAGNGPAATATAPAPAAAKPAAAAPAPAASAVPKVNLASLDFNKFFQSGGDGEASPEASPASKNTATGAAVPQGQQAQQQPQQQQQQHNNALHASTASNAQGQQHPSAPRRPSTYENNANAMSPRMMAAGLPPSGTPGMPHHINARPFSPAGMNKGIPNSQQGYYQGGQGGMGIPGSPSTFVPGQLPPGAYANAPQQGGAGYSGGAGMPGTPGPAGNKMNGVPGGPHSAAGGPRQQQTTPYMQNRQAPPNAAQHQIHHQQNRSIGSGSPRLPHASAPGQPSAQPFYPSQQYAGQQWVQGYPGYNPYGYNQYGQPNFYAQGQQPGQQGRPPLQAQHSSQQSISSSPVPSMRPNLSASASGSWAPSSATDGQSGAATPSTFPSSGPSPAPSATSSAALPFRAPPHMPSTPSHGGPQSSISQTLHASSPSFTPSFTPSHAQSPVYGAPAASPIGAGSLNAGASSFAFRPPVLGKAPSKALQIKKPPTKEEREKAEKEKAEKDAAEKAKADAEKSAEDKASKDKEDAGIAAEKKVVDDKAAADKKVVDDKTAADKKVVDDKVAADKQVAADKKVTDDKEAADQKAKKEQGEREAQQQADLEKKIKQQEEEATRVREKKDAEEKATQEREEAEKKQKDEQAAAVATAETEKKQLDEENATAAAAASAAKATEAEKSQPTTAAPSGTATPAEASAATAPSGSAKRPEPLDLSKTAGLSDETITAPGSALSQARIIEDLAAVTYPEDIKSPDAKLNQSAKPGKFRYDRDFLLQFMAVCKEKPEQLPSLEQLGMTDEGPPSAGVGMPRSVSHGGKARAGGSVPSTPMSGRGIPPGISRTVSSNFAGMGNFSAPNLNPAALSSAERFAAASSGSLPGRPMARTPSTTGGIPMGGPSGRGGDRRSGRGTRRGPPQPTPSQIPSDFAPLELSENRWTPTVQSRVGKDQPEDSPEIVERKVKALLNKLTIENFESISKQILDWANKSAKEQDGRILKQVIALIFEKATDEATWSAVYAKLCLYLNNYLSPDVADQSIKEQNGSATAGGRLFRRYLLTRCQADYERGWAQKESATAAAKGKAADDKAKKDALEKEAEAAGVDKEAAVKGADFSEEYYAAEKAKRRGLGLVRFIGELYKLGMLKERIMHECIKKLLANLDTPEEEDIESLCRLLLTVGYQIENTSKDGHGYMDIYFVRLKAIVDNNTVSSRLVFMIQDLMDTRKNGWKSKSLPTGPKSIAEVHQDAARQREEEARRASQGKGLPSRIPMDRGGSRRGQGREAGPDGWQNAPAPRPQKAGDLTTLGKIRSSSGSPSLGLLGKTGAKAPAKEESSMTSNAFALLAGGGEEKEHESMSPPAESTMRRPLQLQPRTKTAENTSETAAGEEEEGEIKESEDESSEMDEATKRSIANSVAEYLSVKMVDEAKQTFESLAPRFRPELAKAFIEKGVAGKADPVAAVLNLFKALGETDLLSREAFRDSFIPTVADLEDLAGDAPMAWTHVANLFKAVKLTKEDVEYLQKQMISNEDDLENIQNQLMKAYEKASA